MLTLSILSVLFTQDTCATGSSILTCEIRKEVFLHGYKSARALRKTNTARISKVIYVGIARKVSLFHVGTCRVFGLQNIFFYSNINAQDYIAIVFDAILLNLCKWWHIIIMGGYKAFDMLLKLSSRYHTFGIEFCSKIRFINVVLIGIKFKLKSPRDQIMNGIYPRCRYADGLYCETLGTFSQWNCDCGKTTATTSLDHWDL